MIEDTFTSLEAPFEKIDNNLSELANWARSNVQPFINFSPLFLQPRFEFIHIIHHQIVSVLLACLLVCRLSVSKRSLLMLCSCRIPFASDTCRSTAINFDLSPAPSPPVHQVYQGRRLTNQSHRQTLSPSRAWRLFQLPNHMCFSNSVVWLFADVASTSATPNGKTGNNNTPVLLHQPSLCCLQSVVGCGRGGRGLFKAHTHHLLCLKVGATLNEVRCQKKGASYCIHTGCIAVLPCFISFWSAALCIRAVLYKGAILGFLYHRVHDHHHHRYERQSNFSKMRSITVNLFGVLLLIASTKAAAAGIDRKASGDNVVVCSRYPPPSPHLFRHTNTIA